jgi:peptidyl-prolyl cis-trans isomerase SurA
MRKIALFCFSAVAAALLSTVSFGQTRDIGVHGELLDRIAAIVNDGLVLKSELDAQMDAVTKRLQEQKVELPSQSVLKQQVLDRLILQEIQSQHAKRVGLTAVAGSGAGITSLSSSYASMTTPVFDVLLP